jgi:hypothetical protein
MLKWILEEIGSGVTDWREGFCEHGNKPLGSIKCWEILEKLNDWQLHKKDSAAWS